MRVLGIDFGDTNIGLAVSDESRTLATPFFNLKNNRKSLLEIKKICEEKEINVIVIGFPIGFNRQENEQTRKVKIFAEKLHNLLPDIEQVFEDEMFTTQMAIEKKYKKDSEPSDKNAAAIILQSYLDKLK